MDRKFLTKAQIADLLRNNPSDYIYGSQVRHWYLLYGTNVIVEPEAQESEENLVDETRDENVQDSEGNE